MSYESREKKRKYKAAERAEAKAQRVQRLVNPGGWFLTIVKQEAHCAGCAGALRPGGDMVFRHTPLEMLCTSCASSREIKYRTSRSYDQRERKRRGRRSRPMIADRSRPSSSTAGQAEQKAFGEDMLRRVRAVGK